MAAPLQGIKVIDCAQVLAGPFGAAMLGDLGADVIKIEPLRGDESRHLGVGAGLDSALFVGANRSKRGIALDIHSADGRQVLHKLLTDADVLIDNMRSAAKRKAGLDFESLKCLNQDIISISISAFGTSGPYAGRAGIDPLVQALGGIMATTGRKDEPPLRVGSPIVDAATAHMVVIAVFAALRRKDQNGCGELIEINMLDTLFNLQPTTISQYLISGHEPPAIGCSSDLMAPYGLYRAKDGRYWQVVALNQKFFRNICEALESEHLLDDERFLSNDKRLVHREELENILSTTISRYESDELSKRFHDADVMAAPVQSIAEVTADPQLRHNNMIVKTCHARLGDIASGALPIRFTDSEPAAGLQAAPTLGQHTHSVLSELGYGEHEIDSMEHNGAIIRSDAASD
ncbi:MAG: CoA transferase [Pseudomonadota bacterium]